LQNQFYSPKAQAKNQEHAKMTGLQVNAMKEEEANDDLEQTLQESVKAMRTFSELKEASATKLPNIIPHQSLQFATVSHDKEHVTPKKK
jgi:hypothetical protein